MQVKHNSLVRKTPLVKADLLGEWNLEKFFAKHPGRDFEEWRWGSNGSVKYGENGLVKVEIYGDIPICEGEPKYANSIVSIGKFIIDTASGAVLHQLTGSNRPSWIGKEFSFKVSIEGELMIVKGEYPDFEINQLWRRKPDEHFHELMVTRANPLDK